MRGLFVTGTDTGVGKTVVSCLIARQLQSAGARVGCYKPVCSGSDVSPDGSRHWPDVDALSHALGDAFSTDLICPQRFHAPLAPPSAAAIEGTCVDRRLLRDGAARWALHAQILIVEGVGGWLCPIAEHETIADLAADLGCPVVIVSALKLGTINHTLLTAESVERRGLQVAGIIFNEVAALPQTDAHSMIQEIRDRVTVPLLGIVRHNRTDELESIGGDAVDWIPLSGPLRPSLGTSVEISLK